MHGRRRGLRGGQGLVMCGGLGKRFGFCPNWDGNLLKDFQKNVLVDAVFKRGWEEF